MPEPEQIPPTTDDREISRLVAKARAQGQPDAFFGKRRWTRYQLGLRLEVTRGDTAPEDTWTVVMHNISGGGFGFWSKRELRPGDAILVRELTDSHAAEWLTARVTHATVGLQGYLIGARFERPCEPDQDADARELVVHKPERRDRPEADAHTVRRWSLQAKCAWVAGLAACAAAAATSLVFRFFPEIPHRWTWTVALALVGGLGALVGWIAWRSESRFLRSLRLAIHQMAKGTAVPSLLVPAPCRELDSLRRAFLDLGARWHRRGEKERAQRQKLEEMTQVKSNILAIVSHDLRTPLTSILLYAQMLTDELGVLALDDQRRFLGIISEECTRLSRLVDDLLEVQRLESGRIRWDLRSQDLSGTIRNCARVFEAIAVSKSIDFTVSCPDSLPPAEADADKISQVLSNLLSNAMKYAPVGGRVRLSAEARENEILLRVADSGPGIPRDKWDQIFDRFSQLSDLNTRQIDGVGLGLYIVKRIVECHGGVAWVDSEMGRGSEFCVLLPTKAANVKARPDAEATTSAGHIVLCDPDPELGAVVAQALRWENFDVRVCHSGSRLFAQLESGPVDVVITDVLLPDMNATEVLETLNRFPNRSFSLIVHSYAGDGVELQRRGADVFLRRPVSREDLVRAVRVAIRERSLPGSAVLVIDPGGLDTASLCRLLSREGQTPLVVKSMETAVARMRSRSVGVVLVPDAALAPNWENLRDLAASAGDDTRLIVLCDSVRKRERSLAERYQVAAVSYRPDHEEEIVGALQASERLLAAELSA